MHQVESCGLLTAVNAVNVGFLTEPSIHTNAHRMLAIHSMRHRTPTPEDAAYTVCAQPVTTMFGISFSRPSVPRFAAPPNVL